MDDAEHVVCGQVEDRQPVEDLAAGDAYALDLPVRQPLCRGGHSRLAGCFGRSRDAHRGGDGLSGKRRNLSWMVSVFAIPGTISLTDSGKLAVFLDMIEQGFSGRNWRQDQRYAVRQRCFDMPDGPGQLDLAEWHMNGNKLIPGNNAGKQDDRGLAVLTANGVDGDESSRLDLMGEYGCWRGWWPRIGFPVGGAGDRFPASGFAGRSPTISVGRVTQTGKSCIYDGAHRSRAVVKREARIGRVRILLQKRSDDWNSHGMLVIEKPLQAKKGARHDRSQT